MCAHGAGKLKGRVRQRVCNYPGHKAVMAVMMMSEYKHSTHTHSRYTHTHTYICIYKERHS